MTALAAVSSSASAGCRSRAAPGWVVTVTTAPRPAQLDGGTSRALFPQ